MFQTMLHSKKRIEYVYFLKHFFVFRNEYHYSNSF